MKNILFGTLLKYREFRLSLCLFLIYVSILSYFAYGYREFFSSSEGAANLSSSAIMEKKKNTRVKPEVQYGSRTVGEILLENQLFKDIYPNTELGTDLKLLTRKPGRTPIGECLDGVLTHDGEDHFTFIQNANEMKKMVVHRSPIIFKGECINVHKKEDGSLLLTFNRPQFSEDFTFQDFCRKAAEELFVFACHVGKVGE